ncbi:hypothetical protein LINPERHAP2_LOCUS15832 [Linum perenne]
MDLANVVNPLWGALPQDLQRHLVVLTIQSRIEDQIERLRESILIRYGRLDSPLRHLDWHPRYIGMNIFYLPMCLWRRFATCCGIWLANVLLG